MKIEDQVCSLELAKKLKELGVKQESLFYYVKEEDPYVWYNSQNFNYPMKAVDWYFSAFTVAELGDILPSGIISEKHINGGWRCKDLFRYSSTEKDISEVNARAKMLIYLIENGYVKNE